jgi:hypothetical protein
MRGLVCIFRKTRKIKSDLLSFCFQLNDWKCSKYDKLFGCSDNLVFVLETETKLAIKEMAQKIAKQIQREWQRCAQWVRDVLSRKTLKAKGIFS